MAPIRPYVPVALSLVACILVTAPAHGECVVLTADALMKVVSDVIFAGTVTEITRSGEYGYRARFDVDRVWKGSVSKTFDLYVSEVRGELPTFVRGQRYIAVARQLTNSVERAELGLALMDAPVYGPVQCSGALPPTIERDLGVGKPPSGTER